MAVIFPLTVLERSSKLCFIMNRLSTEKRAQIVGMIVEGNSIRSITRMTGVCQEAITKLLCDLGKACADHHNATIRGIRSRHIQCD